MLRSLSYAISVRKLFNRCHPTDFQIATFTRSPTNFKYQDPKEREPCPTPEPPPPPPPKDDRLVWGTLTVLILTGGFIIYAKGKPELRDWLILNAPWVDDLIAVLYQENMTFGELALSCIDSAKTFINDHKGSVAPRDTKPKKCSTDGEPVDNKGVCYKEPPKEKEEVKPEKGKEKVKEKGKEKEVCQEPQSVAKQDICEIEKCMLELGESVINNYYTAKEACACYNSLVEDTMQTFTFRGMKALRHAMEERNELVKVSLSNASACSNKFDELTRYLDCGVIATKDQIKNTKFLHKDFHERFKAGFMAYQWENDRSTVMDAQWQLVEEIVDKYASENELIFTGLKYSDKKPHTNGDLDILFTNSLRYIDYLEAQLKDLSSGMTDRVNRALEGWDSTCNDLPQSPEREKTKLALLANALKEKRAASEKDYKKREEEQKQLNERNLKESMRKLQENHEARLAEQMLTIETEVMDKFNHMVAEKVAAEKRVFAKELEEMALRLKVVEAKLAVRLKVERETRCSQELWAAGASLLAATKKGDPFVRVDKELKAIERASGGDDKLVLTVLKSIPDSVREKGIVPESVLRDGFRVMEKTARSVALVEQEGARMPVYILSWLQGLLLFMKMSGIPQREFEKPPLDPPPDLDTFDLLQRASFWVERGNLAVALRYVESLKGASRAASKKWFDAARAHLEVRQAAEAILAHAAAMGLRYI